MATKRLQIAAIHLRLLLEDNQPVIVTATAPWDGASNVPLNPVFHMVFDEPIHPLSVSKSGKDQITFLAGNQQVRYLKDQPLPANDDVQEVLAGIMDRSGNELIEKVIGFKTSDVFDTIAPAYPIYFTPGSGAENVPVNSMIEVLMNEALSPFMISSSNVYLRQTNNNYFVPMTVSISPDGRALRIIPTVPLLGNTDYMAHIEYVPDIANNKSEYITLQFTTGESTDNTSPVIVNTGVDGNPTDIPLNARINIRFSEPMNINKLDGVVLLCDGVLVPVEKTLGQLSHIADHNRGLLTLTPLQLLKPENTCQLKVSNVEDRAGNLLAEPVERLFNISSSFDIAPLHSVTYKPAYGAINVSVDSVIELSYTKKLDLTNQDSNAIIVRNTTDNEAVVGRITLSADRKSLFFTPSSPFKPGKRYTVYFGGSTSNRKIYDITGKYVSDYNFYFTTKN
jgi:hypothetical protein